jgi:opacity protein-like surface antigen
VCAFLTIASTTNAQEQQAPTATTSKSIIDLNQGVSFEVSPHTLLMGSSGGLGLRLSMNYSSFNLELSGEQVIGKFANLYPISVNALLNLATRNQLIPYGMAGVGLLVAKPTNSIGDETVTSLAVNFGGGARYYVSKTFGIRLEVKQYVASIKNDRELKNDLLFFQEFSVGATFMLH